MEQGSWYKHKDFIFARARAFGQFLFAAKITLLFVAVATGAQTAEDKKPAAQPILIVQPDLESSNDSARLQALELHRTKGGRIPEAKIRAKLKTEKNPQIRRRLNQALADADSPYVLASLKDSLKNDPDPTVRQGAAESLTKYAQDPGVTAALAEALKNDTNSPVRYACALALALSDSPVSVSALEIASKDNDPLLRSQVAYALQRHTSRRARTILRTLQSDRDVSVRHVAGAQN